MLTAAALLTGAAFVAAATAPAPEAIAVSLGGRQSLQPRQNGEVSCCLHTTSLVPKFGPMRLSDNVF